MKKILALILTLACAFAFASCADIYAKGSVCEVRENGDAELDVMPQKVLEKADIGDTVLVDVASFRGDIPFVDKLIEEEGKIQLYLDREEWCVCVCVFGGNFSEVFEVCDGDEFVIKKTGDGE